MSTPDAPVPPDAVVRTALELLPVPDHADGFWSGLWGAIDADEPLAAASEPVLELVPEPTVALVPAAMRRPSNVVLVAVAAAAVVVVVLAGSSLLDGRSGTEQVAANLEPSPELDALVDGAKLSAGSPTTLSPAGAGASSTAVLAWVDHVTSGRSDDAWQAMAADSQAHFGSQAAFEEQLTTFATAYAGWDGVDPDQVLVTPVHSDDQGDLAVVTLLGTLAPEGETPLSAAAVPVRLIDGVAWIEPFADAGAMEVVAPAAAANDDQHLAMAVADEVVIVVPTDVDAPVLRLDDGDPVVCGEADGTRLTALDDTPGQRCAYSPPKGMSRGEHTLTMACVGPGASSISARSLVFEAA